MGTFKKRFVCLSALLTMTVCMAFAQHGTAIDVENPGSKGLLPAVPVIEPAQEGLINCLSLESVGMDALVINGYRKIEAKLIWIGDANWGEDIESLYGATSCTLQYRQHGTSEWEKYEDYDARYESGAAITACYPSVSYPLTDYRLVFHGGEKDGWVSNVVTAKQPVMCSRWKYWGDDQWQEFNIVGKEMGNDFNVTVETYVEEDESYKTYTNEDNCYTFQWYRRNPNTWEMTAIEGANKRSYTPVLDDAGYDLLLDVSGDDVHCSFTLRYNFGMTYLVVQGSIGQFLYDGFILYTDYVLPEPKKDLILVDAQIWGENPQEGEPMDVTEIKPGQYAIRMNIEKYQHRMINMSAPGNKLSFLYNLGKPEPTYREAQLMTDRYIGQFNVKAQLEGVDVAGTTIDVISKNIDGEQKVVASQSFSELGRDMIPFNLLKGVYYLRARKTDTAMETYYPSTLLWAEAEVVSPVLTWGQQQQPWQDDPGEGGGKDDSGQENDGVMAGTRAYEVSFDEGGSDIPTFTITMLPVPAPLTGVGVIEGTVVLENESAGTRGGDDETACRVYLKVKEAEVIAQTETDANGKFRFENVPYGDFQVLLDVEGRSMKSESVVTVSEEVPEVVAVDYVVTDDEILTPDEYIADKTIETIQISGAKQVTYMSDKDLDFTTKPELRAYVATGYDKISGTIWLTRVKDVPAMTGFLLMGDAGSYDIPVKSDGSTSYYMNLFNGTIEGTTIKTYEGVCTNYYLSNGDAGVGFYKVTKEEGVALGANRAYLSVPTEIPTVGSEGSTETIKVSAAGQVPYYNSQSLDFSSLDAQGVKAYTATGYDYKSGTIWLTRVKQVPAETGILIMAPQGEYPVPTASVASAYANMFKGTLSGITIFTHETIVGKDYINYYLSSGDAGVGFYKVTKEEGVTIGANRCYLPILNKTAAAGTRSVGSVKTLFKARAASEVIGIPLLRGIGGDGDGTTSIKDLAPALSKSEGAYYNLHGQRVANPSKGLYIKNGKKYVIK